MQTHQQELTQIFGAIAQGAQRIGYAKVINYARIATSYMLATQTDKAYNGDDVPARMSKPDWEKETHKALETLKRTDRYDAVKRGKELAERFMKQERNIKTFALHATEGEYSKAFEIVRLIAVEMGTAKGRVTDSQFIRTLTGEAQSIQSDRARKAARRKQRETDAEAAENRAATKFGKQASEAIGKRDADKVSQGDIVSIIEAALDKADRQTLEELHAMIETRLAQPEDGATDAAAAVEAAVETETEAKKAA